MTVEMFELEGSDGKSIHTRCWRPSGDLKAAVQVAHGMGEHIGRYDRVAKRLNEAGYVVYGNDLRGHGTTDPDRLGDMGEDGWNFTLEDAKRLNECIDANHPTLKRVLVGHSMGAMLAQQYLYRYGHTLDGAVLSGSPGIANPLQALFTGLVARFETWRLGPTAESELLQNLLFAKANKAFDDEAATGFEWLSRDSAEVQKYVDDPQCGGVLRAGSLVLLSNGAREAARRANVGTIPKDLPIYVFSGSDDPVHGEEKNLQRLLDKYRAADLKVDYRLYPGGRHEMFNETNRDAVIDDLIAWLNSRISG